MRMGMAVTKNPFHLNSFFVDEWISIGYNNTKMMIRSMMAANIDKMISFLIGFEGNG